VFTDKGNKQTCLFDTWFGSSYLDRDELDKRVDNTIDATSFSAGYMQGKDNQIEINSFSRGYEEGLKSRS
jgi:hypothetical protein